jgi:hypothetical protein
MTVGILNRADEFKQLDWPCCVVCNKPIVGRKRNARYCNEHSSYREKPGYIRLEERRLFIDELLADEVCPYQSVTVEGLVSLGATNGETKVLEPLCQGCYKHYEPHQFAPAFLDRINIEIQGKTKVYFKPKTEVVLLCRKCYRKREETGI